MVLASGNERIENGIVLGKNGYGNIIIARSAEHNSLASWRAYLHREFAVVFMHGGGWAFHPFDFLVRQHLGYDKAYATFNQHGESLFAAFKVGAAVRHGRHDEPVANTHPADLGVFK